jgi:hypothetical protein
MTRPIHSRPGRRTRPRASATSASSSRIGASRVAEKRTRKVAPTASTVASHQAQRPLRANPQNAYAEAAKPSAVARSSVTTPAWASASGASA